MDKVSPAMAAVIGALAGYFVFKKKPGLGLALGGAAGYALAGGFGGTGGPSTVWLTPVKVPATPPEISTTMV